MLRKLLGALLCATLILASSGCSMGRLIKAINESESKGETDSAGNVIFTHALGEPFSVGILSITINSAQFTADYDEHKPENPENKFLIVRITVKNNDEYYGETTVYGNNFGLVWDAIGETPIYPERNFSDKMLPAEFDIFRGYTRSGELVYEVPGDETKFKLIYEDYKYEDYEKYDKHVINLTPKASSGM